ncbi:MAG TPA: phosphatidylserine decarboxylase family protein [Desulfonauticus sp.]|nr:MAG: Phosphatidylserine decarboxylase proenzyme [Desulfonauticus sp. 38_4375]HCO12377.1 phosphatidylserine decarboxylase family protein [Desulfonauticus sp.]
MYQPKTRICPEGVPYLLVTGFLALLLALWECEFLSFLAFVLFVLILNFFRDPHRVIPPEANVAVAPADGKIIKIEPAKCPLTGEDRLLISTFMNVFNVHINRSPIKAQVQKQVYIPGKFFNASLDKASKDNERNLILLQDEEGKLWTVVQIAGLIARRIVSFAKPEEALQRGERFGLIKFGSRVDLYLPSSYEPEVKIGDKVLAGATILARKKDG